MPKKGSAITDAELALLSLLMENPMHGYQIEQIIEERGMREWTPIGFSSIYYLLDKMKDKGWLASSLSQSTGKGPARQIYRVTLAGKKTWKDAALSALENPHRAYGNFILGLASLPLLEHNEILKGVTHYRGLLRARQDRLQKKLAGYAGTLPWQVDELFQYSLALVSAELAWVERFLQKITERIAESKQ